ncbi:MAG: hypothetical protein FWB78_07535 [Treponema sp.]|nr:hypothetical protein [Treponema sp.]
MAQTVEIPANRRIFLDLPHELPTDKAKVELNMILEDVSPIKVAFP